VSALFIRYRDSRTLHRSEITPVVYVLSGAGMSEPDPPVDRGRSPGSRLLSGVDRLASRPLAALIVLTADTAWVLVSVAAGFPSRRRCIAVSGRRRYSGEVHCGDEGKTPQVVRRKKLLNLTGGPGDAGWHDRASDALGDIRGRQRW
jgi:hypothetical protein